MAVAGSTLTAAYAARFVGGLYGRWSLEGEAAVDATSAGVPVDARAVPVHAPGRGFVLPAGSHEPGSARTVR